MEIKLNSRVCLLSKFRPKETDDSSNDDFYSGIVFAIKDKEALVEWLTRKKEWVPIQNLGLALTDEHGNTCVIIP